MKFHTLLGNLLRSDSSDTKESFKLESELAAANAQNLLVERKLSATQKTHADELDRIAHKNDARLFATRRSYEKKLNAETAAMYELTERNAALTRKYKYVLAGFEEMKTHLNGNKGKRTVKCVAEQLCWACLQKKVGSNLPTVDCTGGDSFPFCSEECRATEICKVQWFV
jgi:hypothetical protein